MCLLSAFIECRRLRRHRGRHKVFYPAMSWCQEPHCSPPCFTPPPDSACPFVVLVMCCFFPFLFNMVTSCGLRLTGQQRPAASLGGALVRPRASPVGRRGLLPSLVPHGCRGQPRAGGGFLASGRERGRRQRVPGGGRGLPRQLYSHDAGEEETRLVCVFFRVLLS